MTTPTSANSIEDKKNVSVNTLLVKFTFTTVRGNLFTGRSGQVSVDTENTIAEAWKDSENLKYICAAFVLTKKPTYKIFEVTITEIEQL